MKKQKMENKKIKKWWRKRERWEKIIVIIVFINLFLSVYYSMKFNSVANKGEVSGSIIFLTIILFVLVVWGLLFLLYVRNSKPHWLLGMVTATVYFISLTFAFYDSIGASGEANLLVIFEFFPFGFLLFFLPGIRTESSFWICTAFIMNFLGIVLVAILFGLFIMDKTTNKKKKNES